MPQLLLAVRFSGPGCPLHRAIVFTRKTSLIQHRLTRKTRQSSPPNRPSGPHDSQYVCGRIGYIA